MLHAGMLAIVYMDLLPSLIISKGNSYNPTWRTIMPCDSEVSPLFGFMASEHRPLQHLSLFGFIASDL